MTDYEISKFVGLRTYCNLYNSSPDLYMERIECKKYENDRFNIVTPYLAENVCMKSIKKDLQYCIKNNVKLDTVKNLINSSYSYEGVAWSLSVSIIWIIVVFVLIGIISYVLVMSGIIHSVLYKNFTPGMVDVKFL